MALVRKVTSSRVQTHKNRCWLMGFLVIGESTPYIRSGKAVTSDMNSLLDGEDGMGDI